MRCVVCKQGDTSKGTATITLERSGMILVFKNVPAEVCGEEYIAEETTARLLSTAEETAKAGVQVDFREYLAA